MNTFYEYETATGEFTGSSQSGPDGWEPFPDGGMSYIKADSVDTSRSRVVQADDGFGNAQRAITNRKPPRPYDTLYIAHEWDETGDAWVPVPTAAAKALDLRRARDRLLQQSDYALLDSVAEATAAVSGPRVTTPATGRIQTLLAYRQTLRDLPIQPGFTQMSISDIPPLP